MGEVKWIHIATGIFDDEKIKVIEDMPDADVIIVIWFKLLCLAGIENNNGTITFSDRIHYTDKMLASVFRRKESTVSMALEVFERFGMIEIIDGVITIPNWEKHQNIEGLERIREGGRRRVAAFREREKLKIAEKSSAGNVTRNVTDRYSNGIEEEGEEEREEEGEREEEKKKEGSEIPSSPEATDRWTVGEIVALYNETCRSLPKVTAISDARRKAVKARQNQYADEAIRQVFEKAEASSFLKGGNSRDWMASFDWIMNANNFAKILDGNYDNRGGQQAAGGVRPKGAEELDAAYKMMADWAEEGENDERAN